MPKDDLFDINDILLEAHKRGLESAIEASIRTGIPLVVKKRGKIVNLKPKYKYVKVPIQSKHSKI